MAGIDGLQATRKIRQSFPETRILILTQYDDKEYILPLLQAGASGYLVKLTRANELIDAIRAVHTEGAYLPPEIARAVVNNLTATARPTPEASLLSEREKEVIRLIAGGATSREIGDRLHISARTVDTHRG